MIRFRQFVIVLLLALGVACPLTHAIASNDSNTLRVELDYARLARMPQGAQTFIIGNPSIADITMLKDSRLMVVTGRSFGTTNLIMLDRGGKQVQESLITVVPPEDKLVVYRGRSRESLSCKPRCVRTMDMADDPAIMKETIDSTRTHSGAISSQGK